ncbi:hypothetical protein BZB76_1051 [Actinomadura pelletieri DSM 43383]|uniref:Uncharacterized protein n=1 Tax=Actinomadura pelletieri DSM 43383 TaxID=1120940 RepID=A0A495QZS8_9ACTN|nr:hypothetical protein [Actinomadura pelletieri]RKS79577.1 hypothetical protein BZB76_1051 [Actinomadura pelletieri DSM 43383]
MRTRAYTDTDDPALRQLREEFTGHRIWRSRRWDGRLGDWVATLHDPAAGVDATVICSDSTALREALVRERERAELRCVERAW